MTLDLYSKFDISIRWNLHSHMKELLWIQFWKNAFSDQNSCFKFTTRDFWWDIWRDAVMIEHLLNVFELLTLSCDRLRSVAIGYGQ